MKSMAWEMEEMRRTIAGFFLRATAAVAAGSGAETAATSESPEAPATLPAPHESLAKPPAPKAPLAATEPRQGTKAARHFSPKLPRGEGLIDPANAGSAI